MILFKIPGLNWIVDAGSVAHFFFGIFTALCGIGLHWIWPLIFMIMFEIEQIRDWLDGEDPHETELDVAEYVAGLILALIFVKLVI